MKALLSTIVQDVRRNVRILINLNVVILAGTVNILETFLLINC